MCTNFWSCLYSDIGDSDNWYLYTDSCSVFEFYFSQAAPAQKYQQLSASTSQTAPCRASWQSSLLLPSCKAQPSLPQVHLVLLCAPALAMSRCSKQTSLRRPPVLHLLRCWWPPLWDWCWASLAAPTLPGQKSLLLQLLWTRRPSWRQRLRKPRQPSRRTPKARKSVWRSRSHSSRRLRRLLKRTLQPSEGAL